LRLLLLVRPSVRFRQPEWLNPGEKVERGRAGQRHDGCVMNKDSRTISMFKNIKNYKKIILFVCNYVNVPPFWVCRNLPLLLESTVS
jgi:hypothetical protein